LNRKKDKDIVLEIQVLAWERHKKHCMAGLNQLMGCIGNYLIYQSQLNFPPSFWLDTVLSNITTLMKQLRNFTNI
jgi:hypothetical protein